MEWGSVSMLRFSGALVLTSPRNCLSKVTCLPSKGQIVHCRKYFTLLNIHRQARVLRWFKVTLAVLFYFFYIFRLNESYDSNIGRKTDREVEKTMQSEEMW